jgi:hypothetical protein
VRVNPLFALVARTAIAIFAAAGLGTLSPSIRTAPSLDEL